MQILLIKTGCTVPNVAKRRGDFEDWFAAGLGIPCSSLEVREVFEGEDLPKVGAFSAVVVTGSPAMVTDEADWSLKTERWLADAVTTRVPVLGVCYGHQLLARAVGGTVADNPAGRQVGTVDVHLTGEGTHDPLLGQLPPIMHVPVSHNQAVVDLPSSAIRLARSPRDGNHAFAVGTRAWGVQFHPEFDADIVRGYIEARRTQIFAEGIDADAVAAGARDSSDGHTLLRAFAAIAGITSC